MNKLKEARQAKGLTPTQLAAAAGVSEQTYRRWEAQGDLLAVRLEQATAVADILEKPLSFFAINNN